LLGLRDQRERQDLLVPAVLLDSAEHQGLQDLLVPTVHQDQVETPAHLVLLVLQDLAELQDQ
jgi:hypothetical protein